MTKEEMELVKEIVKDHPTRQFFDGKRKSDYVPSAREVLRMLGKEKPDNEPIT